MSEQPERPALENEEWEGPLRKYLDGLRSSPNVDEVVAAIKRRRKLNLLAAAAKIDAIEPRLDALLQQQSTGAVGLQAAPIDATLLRIDQMRDSIANADARVLALADRSHGWARLAEERTKQLADGNAALAASVEALGIKITEVLSSARVEKDETNSWLVVMASATLPIVLIGIGFAFAKLMGN